MPRLATLYIQQSAQRLEQICDAALCLLIVANSRPDHLQLLAQGLERALLGRRSRRIGRTNDETAGNLEQPCEIGVRDKRQLAVPLGLELALEGLEEFLRDLVGPLDHPSRHTRHRGDVRAVRAFRHAGNQLVQEDDLTRSVHDPQDKADTYPSLDVVDVGLHVHAPDVWVVCKVVCQRAVMRLKALAIDFSSNRKMRSQRRNLEAKCAWQGDAARLPQWPYRHTSKYLGPVLERCQRRSRRPKT